MIDLLNEALALAKNTAMYKIKLGNLTHINSLDEFHKIPYTTKQDLRDSYPYDNLGVDRAEVIEVHTSSGTTGKPTLSLFTQDDLRLSNQYISMAWKNFGIDTSSTVQFMMSYGMFSGAALNTYALQSLGALVIPAGIQSTEKQVDLITEFKTDTLVATPSYYIWLYKYLEHHKIDPKSLGLKTGIAAGEPYSDALKQKISRVLGIRVFDHYGLCEANTGIIYECAACSKMAVVKDYVYAEVINPDTGEPVAVGEQGELVLTTTMKQASPVIRYRTGDIVSLLDKDSDCQNCHGSVLVSRIKGRVGSTIFYKGLLLDPYEIRDFIMLEYHHEVTNHIKFIVTVDSDDIVTHIVIKLSPYGIQAQEALMQRLEHRLYKQTKATISVEFVPEEFFDNVSMKVKLVEYERQ